MSSPPSVDSYDWSDVTPTSYFEGEVPLAQIVYAEDYKTYTGLLRTLMAKPEYSARGLALTAAVVRINPAHYTGWEFRYQTLKQLGDSWLEKSEQLVQDAKMPAAEHGRWINEITLSNPKNYQIWNYRKSLYVPNSKDYFDGERLTVGVVLEDDEKNFHAWSHYKWLLKQLKAEGKSDQVEGFRFVNDFLDSDLRNNSAWSFRYWLWEIEDQQTLANPEAFAEEIKFVEQKMQKAPENEAAWNYVKGLYQRYRSPKDIIELLPLCIQHKESSTRALELLAEIYRANNEINKSLNSYEALIDRVPMRKGYWDYKRKQLIA